MVNKRVEKEDVPLISIESANLRCDYLTEDWTLRDLHKDCGAFVLLGKEFITLTEDTAILNVVLINRSDVSIKIFLQMLWKATMLIIFYRRNISNISQFLHR